MPAPPQLNILLITTDEQRFDAIGCNGNRHIQTPHLDALAAESINLRGHTTSHPVCTPARGSIMTGLYSRSHGADRCGKRLPVDLPCLTHLLDAAGYRCGIAGKAHFEAELSNFAETLPSHQPYYGFHEHHLTEDNQVGEYLRWVKEMHPQHYDAIRFINHEGVRDTPFPTPKPGHLAPVFPSAAPEEVHQTAWITDRTIDMIDTANQAGQPFFAWCSYVTPHHPWHPPYPFAGRHDPASLPTPLPPTPLDAELFGNGYCGGKGLSEEGIRHMIAAYYDMIAHIDHHVGRLMDHLRHRGLLDNTIIVFTSDHGDYNGDRQLIRKGPRIYENLLRVPMLVRLPGAEGRTCTGLTQHEDIAPTLLEIMGLAVPARMQGISFAPLLQSGKPSLRRYSFFETMSGSKSGPADVAVRDDRYKLIHYVTSDRCELYDLAEDPNETANLCATAGARPVLQRLQDELSRWLAKTPQHPPIPREFIW